MKQLHDYQHVASAHLREHPRSALFLDMGLGKTASSLSAIEPRHLPVLVVAPKRVASDVWPIETREWRPDLSLSLAAGTPDQRARAIARGADITVIGRDNLKDVAARGTYSTVILDELSGFKTRASQRWKLARQLLRRTRHVWGLTGTPAPNGLMDLWAQMYLLDEGMRLGESLTMYRSRYFTPGRQLASGVVTEWLLRPGADARIHDMISDICLSMGTEGRINLPPVTYNTIRVNLPPAVMAVYKRMKRELVADLSLLGGEIHTAANAAVLTNKLSQISAGFLYPDEPGGTVSELHREKCAAVTEVVEGTGSPVLVFYRYKAEREQLLAALPGARTIEEPGVIPAWNEGRVPVLLAHPASAGHGLNLQHGGHTIVWTSLPWSLEEWQQGNKRLARQGQRHPVVIHVITAERTVDSAINERLTTKTSVQDALLKHLESPL